MFDLLLYDKIRQESNILLLLDTDCVSCRTEPARNGRRILSVLGVRHWTEEQFTIEASYFADCTGDGSLAPKPARTIAWGGRRRANTESRWGPKRLTGAHWAAPSLHGAPTRAPHALSAPSWVRRFSEEDLRLRGHREYEYGYWWVEYGGEWDAIKHADHTRHELLSIALGVWDHVKNHCTRPTMTRPWTTTSGWSGAPHGSPKERRTGLSSGLA